MVSANYPNFYETVKEANMRLRGTVVLYDEEPYFIHAITNHKPDGIFRVYCEPLGPVYTANHPSCPLQKIPVETHGFGQEMDEWMDKNKHDIRVIRKHMNSPKFNKFRPFPLGMMNTNGEVRYVERHPTRKSEQGLTRSMLMESFVSVGKQGKPFTQSHLHTDDFRSLILGEYPPASECIKMLKDPNVGNEAAAFHRNFAFVKGPIGTLFLAYKSDIVGTLPNKDQSKVTIDPKFAYVKEVVSELNLFQKVEVE